VNELASAETTGDAAVLDRDTVDDYTIINSQGYRTAKQVLLKGVRDGNYKVESKDVEILEVPRIGRSRGRWSFDNERRMEGCRHQWNQPVHQGLSAAKYSLASANHSTHSRRPKLRRICNKTEVKWKKRGR
jgi:hypothetical protein